MKKLLQKSVMIVFLTLCCLGFNQEIYSQVSGDFRSTASGNWGTSTTWQRYNGTTWQSSGTGANNPGQVPSSTSSVWIQTGHTVTLAANASCNDLHLEITTGQNRLALSTFTLSLNGKLRSYSATLNTIPGTSSSSPSASNNWITSTTGKISVVGVTRNLTVSGEWGATNAGVASPNGFDLEINLTSGETVTLNTGLKARSFNVAVGTLKVAGSNRLAPDTGAASGSNFTIQNGAVVESDQTGTAGSAVIGRSGSGVGGVLNISSGALLKLTGVSPTIAMTTITNNGTVEYGATGNQTMIASTNSGANMSSYTNLTISGSGVKTLALATSVSGTTTVNTGCTLATGSFTLTNNGTANINGSFRLDQGGWGGNTGTYNYGTTGTLVFNNTSGLYGVNSTDTWWPTTNGPVNVTVQGGGGINMNVARTVPSSGTSGTFLLVTGTNAIQGTALTLNGNVQINGGNFQTTPTYGSSSTLIYNTSYGTSNEWTGGASGSVSAGSGVPANVQVLSGTLTLAGGRGVPGNVTVTAGGLTLNATSGDLYIGGNLTNNGTWTNNSRAVRFVGTGTSVINASSGTQFFDYLLIEKTAGTVQLGLTTNVTINTTAGSVLQFLNAGTLDLNRRTLTLNNSGGNILVDGTAGGTAKSIISSTGAAIIAITNNKTASGSASGTLSTDNNITWLLTGGMNFGGVTTINGTLQINSGGFVNTTAPTYGSSSTLIYNSGGTYGRGTEWSATSGAGYPNNVQIQNGTTVDLSANGFADRAIAGNLNLGVVGAASAGSLTMGATTNKLTVGGNVVIGGNTTGTSVLTLSSAIGGDIYLNGNWDTKTNGSYASNTRAVFFQGSGTSTVTTIGAATFDYLFVNKTSGGTVSLANDMTVNNNLTLNAQLVTNSFKVIIPTGNNVTANPNGWVRGNLQKNIPTGTNSRTFEIGDSSNYTPVTLDYTGVTGAGNVIAYTTAGDHPQIGTSDVISNYSVNRNYTLSNSGVTGGSYDATFTFVSGDVDSGAVTGAFGVSRYASGAWTSATVSTRTSTTTKATGLTGYGDFQLGETATTWTAGASTTDWATSGNWSKGVPSASINAVIPSASLYPEISATAAANRMSVASGASVTVKSGYNLTVTAAIDNSGTITVENNANLRQTNNVSNTGSGSTVVKRNTAALMRQDYVMWSSPVSGQQLQAFSPLTLSTRFYTYNPSTDLFVTETPTNNFATGRGYLIRLPNNHPTTPTIWSGTFTGGNANNGTITLSSLTSSKYYSIGNPYPSTINADDFITGNSLTEAIYFWRKTNNSATSSYATYTLAGGVSNSGGDPLGLIPNGFIQVGQGFIAKVPASASSLTFNNTMRVSNNGNQFFRSSLFERSRYWLNLTDGNGFFGQMMVAYMTGATNGYDPAIDGLFFGDSQTALTSIIDNQEYVIQGRSVPFDTSDVVPLAFKSELGGNYTIALNSFDGLFDTESQDIYIKDNLTNTIQNMKTGSYSFTSAPGVFNDRFEVVYENLLSVQPNQFTANQVVAYTQNNQLVINSGSVKMDRVEIYDIRGRLLVNTSDINASEIKMNIGSTHQVLVVKITSNDRQTVTKKVMN